MKIRALESGDLDALTEFVIEAYHDYPLATWFESEPSVGEIERIFYNKIKGVGSRSLIDIVDEDNGTIVGECEIVKVSYDTGVVGIIVRHGYRGNRVGSSMLVTAINDAVDIGLVKFTAEVLEENKEAIKFFINNGFIPVGYRDVERHGNAERIVMLQKRIR